MAAGMDFGISERVCAARENCRGDSSPVGNSLCDAPFCRRAREICRAPGTQVRAPLTAEGVGVDVPCSLSGVEQDEAIALIWDAIKKKKRWDMLELPCREN
jgi:hypothetical protein